MKIYFFLLFFILWISSCHQKKEYYYITDDSLRKVLDFEEGSYFMYQDSATHEIDTVVCIGRINHISNNDNSHDNEYYERIQVDFSSTMNNKLTYMLGGNKNGLNNIQALMNYFNDPNDKNWVYADLVALPFVEGENKLPSYHPFYTVEGKAYKNVYEYETKYFKNGDSISIYTCFSLENALIKYRWKINHQTHTFLLIDSKIYR